MAKKFLSTLKIVNLPSDPIAGSEGELYFNSSASVAKIYQAGAWSVLGAGGGGGSTTVSTTEPPSPEIGDSWYKNDTGEFYVYDGTYWVEVNGTVSLTQEQVQDYVAPLFTNATNTNVIATYDDANNVINLNTSGSLISVDSITYPDYITFDTTPETTSTATGTVFWDSGDGLAKAVLNANVELGIGQESVALVKNSTGSSISKGKVVYINGAQGQRPTIALSDADTESTSSKTFGFTAEAIADGAEGFVVTEGILRGVNTNGLTEGGAIWLSSTAGGFTQTVPTQPVHSVFLGYVVKANPSSGEIFVKIQNGYELNELHNVLINGVSDNQSLVYNSSASLWQNKLQEEVLLKVYNNSGSVIPQLSPVYYVEDTVNGINVGIADSNSALDPNKLPAIGITKSSIADGSYGNIVIYGKISGIDTNEFDSNDSLFVASGGGLTSSRPTGTANVQEVGKVIVGQSASAGQILVYNTGRKNDIPNIAEGKVWIGNVTSYPVATTLDTLAVPEGGSGPYYFTNERAVDALSSTLSNYLTASAASNSYLTQANASTSYLTQASASTTYLTQPSASSTYAPIVNPVFTSDIQVDGQINLAMSGSVATSYISSFDDLFAGGPSTKLLGRYVQVETDVVDDQFSIISLQPGIISIIASGESSYVSLSGASGQYINSFDPANQIATIGNISASISSHNHTLDSLSNVVITGTPSDGQSIVWDTTTSKWVNETVSGGASYPDQSGNDGKFLQTNSGSVSWQNVDFTGYLTESSASSTYLTQASASTTYLTTESDTLETVTDRGATSTNAITISNTTEATSATTGALIVSGGVGIAKDVWIDGDLHVNGTTVTENTKTVATHDNLIYLNAALDSEITGASGDGTYVTYIADNLYTVGMDIRVTGVSPSTFNIASGDLKTVYAATASSFVVESVITDTYISGGISHAKEEANPDLGFAGGYYDAGYAHAGLFRDASDGIFKFFKGYTPEPDESVNIDTTHASFALAPISAAGLKLYDRQETYSQDGGEDFFFYQEIDHFYNLFNGAEYYKYAVDNLTTSLPLYNITGSFGKTSQTDSVSFEEYNGYDNTHSYISNYHSTFSTIITRQKDNWTPAGGVGSLIGKVGIEMLDYQNITIYGTLNLENALSYTEGGTGLTTLGTAGQVLAVNASATAIEWITPSGGGGSSFTNSSELAALISDETGSGSAVFATSPTLTTPVISGGTIDNASIGATTASSGRFTSVNINGVALTETSTGTSSATSSFNTTVYSAAEYIIYASTSAGNYVSKVMMLARGSATPIITEYAILTQGTAPTVTITPSYSAPNAILTVAVTSGTNIEIIATEVSI